MTKIILFVLNSPAFFLSHRLPLAIAAKQDGYEVHVATMRGDAAKIIVAEGLIFHELPLTRSGTNPLKELVLFAAIYNLLRRLKPDLIHLVTIKPVLYGGIAARLTRVPGVAAAVSGLGFIFLASGLKASILRTAVTSAYRLAFGKKNLKVIFQNSGDRDRFVSGGAVADKKTVLIRGSGVDLAQFSADKEPEGLPVVIMASRLLRDKGVMEYVEAVRLLKHGGINAKFLLVGDIDPHNPATLTKSELDGIREEGNIEILGHRSDIPELFANANIVVLPSYREGLPRVLVEAAAAGRAVITTDAPGCRDAIDPDVSGLLVPVRDAQALASAMQRLIEDKALRLHMGKNSRELAEREFSIEKIVLEHMEIYHFLAANS